MNHLIGTRSTERGSFDSVRDFRAGSLNSFFLNCEVYKRYYLICCLKKKTELQDANSELLGKKTFHISIMIILLVLHLQNNISLQYPIILHQSVTG